MNALATNNQLSLPQGMSKSELILALTLAQQENPVPEVEELKEDEREWGLNAIVEIYINGGPVICDWLQHHRAIQAWSKIIDRLYRS